MASLNMKLSTQIRPISYLKAHASEIVRDLGSKGPSMIITQNGEAKAVLQDIHSYEQAQETLALLKILALGQKQIEEGRVTPLESAVQRIKSGRRAAG
jgi:prevent-host-death family protein